MTTATPKIYEKMCAIMADLASKGIGKDRTNTSGASFKYRGIDDVYNAIAGIMANHRVVCFPEVLNRTQVERQSKNNSALFYTNMQIKFTFCCAEDGSSHSCVMWGEAMDSGDKSTNKAMSVAHKYAFLQVFCIPTEGDNDPDAHSHEVVSQHQTLLNQIKEGLPNISIERLPSAMRPYATEIAQTGLYQGKRPTIEVLTKITQAINMAAYAEHSLELTGVNS